MGRKEDGRGRPSYGHVHAERLRLQSRLGNRPTGDYLNVMTLWLDDRAVIAISGPEARDFLQGLITSDVGHVKPETLAYAALLTPQGKILFDFLVAERDGALLLDCAATSREALVKRLSLYRLRAKVEIASRDDLTVVWSMSRTFQCDPRHPQLGSRTIMAKGEAPTERGAARYEAIRLGLGIPEGRDFGQDKMFALDSGLDELHGIAFDKGCYVGQELTARMKHRGTARKRLLPVDSETPLPAPETPITAGGHEVGTLQSAYGTRGFALVRLDRLDEAASAPLAVAGTTVRIVRPNWLFS